MKKNQAGRPKSCRWVKDMPKVRRFKPQGVPLTGLEEVSLTVDELEALRLADLDGLYQSEAAERMNVSRQTFGRIIDAARKKVADALVNGKSVTIEGGVVVRRQRLAVSDDEHCICTGCGLETAHIHGVPCRETECPECGGLMVRKGRCGTQKPGSDADA